MFDIAELDGQVCQHLSKYDLAQCARVNKRWHTIIVPYLWEDLTRFVNRPGMKTEVLCKLIVEDYLYEQQHQLLQEGDYDMERHSQASSKAIPSLTKYGKWVRWLPDPAELLGGSEDLIEQQQTLLEEYDVEVTVRELILHLFKRCPNFKVRCFMLYHQRFESSGLWTTIVEYLMPRVQDLYVYSSIRDQHSDFRGVADLMDRCSGTLEKMILNVGMSCADDSTMGRINDHEANGSNTGWTSLKEVDLMWCRIMSDPTVFWTWLMKRCRYVKKMKVGNINGIQDVAGCMLKYMRQLDEIWISPTSDGLSDDEMETLLAGSSKGWKILELYCPAILGEFAMKALLKHSSTLEVLCVGNGVDVTSNDLVQVLISCPNLRCLNDASNGRRLEDTGRIHANVFIDQDRETGTLRTWACEASLKDLKIKIMGIPRPDVKEDEAEKETYPGQGREMQGRVYDRIARLVNLETLWLQGDVQYNRHHGCLEMSLESGLHRLKGLKMLKELDVSQTKARIGVQEVQWMTEYWPQLNVIGGLCKKQHYNAIAWLAENRPEIQM